MMSKIIKLFFYYGSFLENTRHRRRAKTDGVLFLPNTCVHFFIADYLYDSEGTEH